MIVAEKILLPTLTERDPDFERTIAVPDTWYISSGVMSDFIDANHFYVFHTHKYRTKEAIDEEYQRIGGLFETASFPNDVTEEFRQLIRQIGEHPIIVRSSSHLEDSFGVAFSGKYQSVFLANTGSEEARLDAFVRAVKAVLASTYGPDPIIYRRDHGLLDYNERMAMIVQKVVGRWFGDWFFPFASGVMYSWNGWAWNPRIRKSDGLVRLVFGLGTRAVDRVGDDYPRMIPLSHPQMRPEITPEAICRYSQQMVDAINLRTGRLESVDLRTIATETQHPDLAQAVSLAADGDVRPPMFRTQELPPQALVLTFDNFLANSPFVALAKKMLADGAGRIRQTRRHGVRLGRREAVHPAVPLALRAARGRQGADSDGHRGGPKALRDALRVLRGRRHGHRVRCLCRSRAPTTGWPRRRRSTGSHGPWGSSTTAWPTGASR